MNERKGRDRDPEHLCRIIERYMKESGLARRASGEDLRVAWREVIGPETGSHTSIHGFRKGVVTVAVDSAPLYQELDLFRKVELLDALRARYRADYVQELRFRLV